MKAHFAVIAALTALVASAAAAEETVPVDSTPRLANGLLMKQGGKLVFAPCRDRSYAIVEDISNGSTVTKALDGIGLEAGRKLYVELFAVLENVTLKATSLNFARADGRCQPSGGPDEAWRATGTGTSAWTLAAGGEHLLVKRAGKPDAKFPFGTVKVDGGATTYEASQDGNKLALRFERGICREKGGELVFGWTASVVVNGDTLKGCAWQR